MSAGYREIPLVEQTLASYLSSDAASSLKAPTLPSKLLKELDEGEGVNAEDIKYYKKSLICLSAPPRRPLVPLGSLWQLW